MKKIVPVLGILTTCFLVSACEKASEPAPVKSQQELALEAARSETRALAAELDKIVPQDFGIGLRAPLDVSPDGHGIVFRVALKQKMFDVTNKEQLEGFQKGVSSSVQNTFCAGTNVAEPMKRYMTQGHYIDFRLVDEEANSLFDIKMDEAYCNVNPQVQALAPEELTALNEKQVKQGFYDDEYLNKVIIPNYRKQLPQAMTSELSVTDVSAENGVLTYHVEYTPNNGKSNPVMIKALLKTLPESTCSLAPVQTLLKNIKAMEYSVETAGTSVDSIKITLDSCGASK